MTRMHLNAFGKESSRQRNYRSAFSILAMIFVVYWVFDFSVGYLVNSYSIYETDANGVAVLINTPTWCAVVLALRGVVRVSFYLYMLVLSTRTRAHIRRNYNIPRSSCCCSGCCGCCWEDFCCSFWLPCCSLTQMARHTADYETYRASCCTETGLPYTVPSVV
jgi:hypothetical protein